MYVNIGWSRTLFLFHHFHHTLHHMYDPSLLIRAILLVGPFLDKSRNCKSCATQMISNRWMCDIHPFLFSLLLRNQHWRVAWRSSLAFHLQVFDDAILNGVAAVIDAHGSLLMRTGCINISTYYIYTWWLSFSIKFPEFLLPFFFFFKKVSVLHCPMGPLDECF